MTYAYDIGLPYGVYLHGLNVAGGVSSWEDQSAPLADYQTTVGNITRRSVPFKFANQQNAPDTFRFTLNYVGIETDADRRHLRYVRSVGGRLNVCLFQYVTETWSSDTAFTDVVTQRRLGLRTLTAMSYTLPGTVETDLPEVARAGSGLTVLTEGAGAGGYVIGTADADGRTPITLGTATTLFTFDYVPLIYMMALAFTKSARDKLAEDWSASLFEAV